MIPDQLNVLFGLVKMGAYKYVGELYKKKQSDVLRFLFRVRYFRFASSLLAPVHRML